jgi:CelD/BcsL family acetyltransferase involved in cellulose biosynthesis
MGHQIDTVRACELDAATIGEWQRLREMSAGLDSPFHDPEWYVAVSRFWPSSRVTFVSDRDGLVAALPHDSVDGTSLRPPAGHLSDQQGAAFRPDADIDMRWLLTRLGAERIVFDHASEGQAWLSGSPIRWVPSPSMNLADGYDEYLARRTADGSRVASWERRKRSLLHRRLGDIGFEPGSTNLDHLHMLTQWKSDQYRRSGQRDLFEDPRVRELVEYLVADAPPVGVRLSVLNAGERTLAVHLGLRSASTWQWWLPAYDPDFHSFSPGTMLLLDIARYGAGSGLQVIDLGKGPESYKQRLADSRLHVGVGSIERRPRRAAIRKRAAHLRRRIRTSPPH